MRFKEPANQAHCNSVIEIMTFRPKHHMALRIGGSPLLVALFVIAIDCPAPASSLIGSVAKTHVEIPHFVTRSSHIQLGNCSEKAVTMRVLISGLQYRLSQPVNVIGVIRNHGSRTCTYLETVAGARAYFAPCGSFPMEVFNASGVSVWPGPIQPSCPMISQKELPAGGHIIASGTWPQTIGFREGSPAAPPGQYRLVIDKRISFTIVVN
jgi:hypothetical protein